MGNSSIFTSAPTVRAVLALVVVLTTMYLFVIQAVIPAGLQTILGVVVTFFFLGQNNDVANAAIASVAAAAGTTAATTVPHTPTE